MPTSSPPKLQDRAVVHADLGPERHQRVVERACAEDRSIASMLRRMADEYLDRHRGDDGD